MLTMQFNDLLNINSVCVDTTSRSQTAILLKVSQLLNKSNPDLDVDTLFDAYWKREAMGSTAIGHGILIPHIRSEHVYESCAAFIRLQNPVDINAEDKQPIDLIFALAIPHQSDNHLSILTRIIKRFSNPTFRNNCRQAAEPEALYAIWIEELK